MLNLQNQKRFAEDLKNCKALPLSPVKEAAALQADTCQLAVNHLTCIKREETQSTISIAVVTTIIYFYVSKCEHACPAVEMKRSCSMLSMLCCHRSTHFLQFFGKELFWTGNIHINQVTNCNTCKKIKEISDKEEIILSSAVVKAMPTSLDL